MPEGIALFKAALAKQDQPQQRKQIVSTFLIQMVDVGKPLEGYRAAPDAAEAFQVLAPDLQGLGRWDELRRLLEAHRQQHPDDLWISFYQAELLLNDRAWDKAAATMELAWDKAPADLRLRFRYRYVFALCKAGRALEAYQKVEPQKDTFFQIANFLLMDKQGAKLLELVPQQRATSRVNPELLYYEARARAMLKQPAEAANLLKQAYQLQKQDFQRRNYVVNLVLDLEAVGLGLEGYRAAPDKAVAFETLARQLVNRKQAKKLEALLQEHGKSQAGSDWQSFFTGELHLLRGDAQKAEQSFAAALARAPNQNHWAFRNGLFRARLKIGKAVATYQEFGPTFRTFEDLANLCLQEKNPRQLEALIAARRQTDAAELNLAVWDLEVRWLDKDYDGVLKLLAERAALFGQPRHRWKHDEYLVRGLVRLKRTEQAVREAEKLTRSSQGNRVLLILALASRGEVKQCIAALEKAGPGYLIGNCYRDPDLGPILRSEAFQSFRERFPEPPEIGRFDEFGDDFRDD